MKIIKEGRNNDIWNMRAKCRGLNKDGCGALLEVSVPDMFHVKMDSRHYYVGEFGGITFYNANMAVFRCLSCQELNEISKLVIPSMLWDKIMSLPITEITKRN